MTKSKLIYLFSLSCVFLAKVSLPNAVAGDGGMLDSISLGKDLFHGISLTGDSMLSCNRCHNTIQLDTFNWNPSAYELGRKFKDQDVESFMEVLLMPMTDVAYESHEEILEYESEYFTYIKHYLDNIATEGLIPLKKDNRNKWQFYGWLLLLVLVLIDLIFLKIISRRVIHLAAFTLALVFIIKITYTESVALGMQAGYQPVQPIKFSHETHCGQNKIECLYCHMPAKYGKSAGFPGVNICMNCHAGVVEASNSGQFEIKKIIDAYEYGRSIKWIRVNNLPDHVFFSHLVHYGIGNIDCAECHGQVEDHHQFVQEQELSMQWCLDCHDRRKVQFDNAYYQIYTEKAMKLKNREVDSVLVRDVGGWDCVLCHY